MSSFEIENLSISEQTKDGIKNESFEKSKNNSTDEELELMNVNDDEVNNHNFYTTNNKRIKFILDNNKVFEYPEAEALPPYKKKEGTKRNDDSDTDEEFHKGKRKKKKSKRTGESDQEDHKGSKHKLIEEERSRLKEKELKKLEIEQEKLLKPKNKKKK